MTQASAAPVASEVKIAVFADCKGALAASYESAIAGANAAFAQHARARPRSSTTPSAGVTGGSVGGATLSFTDYGCGDGSPTTMLRELDRLMVAQGADVLIGPASADEGVAAARWAKSHPSKTIVLGTAPGQEATLQIAPRNVSRYHGDAVQWNAGLGELLYKARGWRSAAVIADDYSPGWESAGGFVADFCAIGGKITARVFPPNGTTDWASYVRQFPDPGSVDGYFWAIGGTGTAAAFRAFEQVFGPLRARQHAGALWQWAQTGSFPPRLTGAYIGGAGVAPALRTAAATAYRKVMSRWYPGIAAELSAAPDYYRAARAVVEGLKKAKGRVGARLQASMPRAVSDPYHVSGGGRMMLDSRRQAIQDQYVLQVNGGRLAKPIAHVPAVDQTFGGVFGPKKPAPGRAFPPCVKRKLPWQGGLRTIKNGRITTQAPKG